MFDKNHFKRAFRAWVDANPKASVDEAMECCRSLMPASVMCSQYWLIDQSLQWFKWLKQQRELTGHDLDDGEEGIYAD